MLLDASGRPIRSREPSPAAPVFQEIATITGGRDVTRAYVQEILDPLADELLATREATLATYRRTHSDWQVMSTYQQRRSALIAREWVVEPGGPRRADRMAADYLREQIQALGSDAERGAQDARPPSGWDSKVDRMHYGIFYGYAVAELMLARDGRHVALEDIRVRDRARFRFASDGTLRLLTTERQTEGETMPARKFWVYSAGADHDDDPYGVGLAHYLHWLVYFKRHGMAAGLRYLERLAQPVPYGRYAPGTGPAEQRKLLDALRAIQHDAGLIFPEGMDVGLLEAKRSASGDYDMQERRLDAAIAKVVLTQTMTSDASAAGLGSSQAEVHAEVAENVQRTDGYLITGSFNAGPARWLTEWNFPGAAAPRVWYVFDEAEDLRAAAERDRLLFETGWQRTEASVRETYGEGYERKPDAVLPGLSALGLEPRALNADNKTIGREEAFAEPAGPDETPARLAAQADTEGGIDAMLAPAERLLSEATTLEEFRDGLLALYAEMDASAFAGVLQRALLAAELAGRYEVSREADDAPAER